MKNQINIALKEWAAVAHGMEEAKQTILLTKAGVKEENGTFFCEQPEFLIYPTRGYAASDVKPDLRPRLSRIDKMAGDSRHIPFKLYCIAEEVVKVTDWEIAKQVASFTVLSDQAVEKLFKEGGWEGFYCVLVRPHTLAMPMDLTRKDSYEQNPLWVSLETSLYTVGSSPVLPDEVWQFTKSKILRILKPT
jgi:hypothetical protein